MMVYKFNNQIFNKFYDVWYYASRKGLLIPDEKFAKIAKGFDNLPWMFHSRKRYITELQFEQSKVMNEQVLYIDEWELTPQEREQYRPTFEDMRGDGINRFD